MPRIKFGGLEGNEAEQEAGEYSTYDGEVPPVAIYSVKLRRLYLTKNKNDEDYMYGFCDIEESGAKQKFNGYTMRMSQNITPQGAGYVNKFLDALGIPRKVFWTSGVVTQKGESGKDDLIIKIGKIKIGDNVFRVSTKKDPYNGEDRLGIVTYLPPREDDEEEYEEDEYDEEEEEEEPEDAEEEEYEEEDDEDYDDEEDEEEPPAKPVKKAPAKKAPAKKAPAKKAAKAAPTKARRRKPEPEPEPDDDDEYEDEYEDEEDPF